MQNQNIWKMKCKPKAYPGQEMMDLGVGRAIRGFCKIEDLLNTIIQISTEISKTERKNCIEQWSTSNKRFIDAFRAYQSMRIFDNARAGAMDQARTDRNYFAHKYEGTEKEYGRLKQFMENVDSILVFLEEAEFQLSNERMKMENGSKQEEIQIVCQVKKQCTQYRGGWVLLAELGSRLSNEGIHYNNLKKVCLEAGMNCVCKKGPDGKNTIMYVK